MTVLVTGATGFVGSSLIPALQRSGHAVRALARDRLRVAADVPVTVGDTVSGAGLDEALEGVTVAYYLVHSMEPGAAFDDRERASVTRFVAAARRRGVSRVVYLGGPVPDGAPLSAHLASRLYVEQTLLDGFPEAVALRASIVIGARSRSFRLLVRLVERLPALVLPGWSERRTAPIDERDAIAMLVAAASTEHAHGGLSLDIPGPEVLTYAAMLERIADALLVRRPAIRLGFSATPIASRVASAVAGEDPALVRPLMESLSTDLLARDDRAADLLGVRRHMFDSALDHALGEWERTEALGAR